MIVVTGNCLILGTVTEDTLVYNPDGGRTTMASSKQHNQ